MSPLGAALATLLAAATPAAEAPPAGRIRQPVTPEAYRLWLRADPAEAVFEGRTEIDLRFAAPLGHAWIHARDLDIRRAELRLADGRRLPVTVAQKSATGAALADWPGEAPAGAATLSIEYRGPVERRPTGLYHGERAGRTYLATQMQPVSARRVFPSLDQPEFRTPFQITVEAPAGLSVVSNAPEVAASAASGGYQRRVFAPTAPIPTYLVALAIGPYDVRPAPAARDVAGRAIPLRGVAVAGRGGDTAWSLDRSRELLAWLSAYFDRPFPYPKLDLVAAAQFAGGGMENAGAIIGNEVRLLTRADDPLDRRRRSVTLQAHEIGHQWFGDDVSPAWWDDLWLNEAFATWIQYKAAAAIWPDGEFERGAIQAGQAAMPVDALSSARSIRSPIETDAQIPQAFDSITYLKGAAVLRMFERYLGEEVFRDGVRRFLARNSGRAATAEDFFAALADASGKPELVQAFRTFVDRPGLPLVAARLECPPGERPRLRLTQSRYAPLGISPVGQPPWTLPLCASFYEPGGGRRTACGLMDGRETVLDAPLESCPALALPNSDGAGYFRFDLSPEQWRALIARGADLPAGEALAAVDSLLGAYRAGRAEAPLVVEGLAAFARHPAWDVADAALDGAAGLADDLPREADRQALAAWARRLLAGRAQAPGSPVARELSRGDLAEFAVLQARDPASLARLAAEGRRAAETGATLERRDLAFTAWLWRSPGTALEPLLGLAASAPDAGLRIDAAAALGRIDRPAGAEALLRRLQTSPVPGEQALQILDGLLARPTTREAAWRWIRDNPKAAVAMVPEPSRGSRLPRYGRGFCSPGEKAEFGAFIAGIAAEIPGYARSLAQTEEAIDACAALRAASGAELAAAIRRAARGHQKLQRLQ